jgi:hypothetical protein
MRRNSNIIGPRQGVTTNNGNGVHDTFDNYNARVLDNWPTVLKIESVTNSSGTQTENTVYSHSVTSSGLVANETLYWKIVDGTTTSTDFYLGAVQGTFTQIASTQSGTFSIEHDFIGDPNKSTRTYTFQILRGGYSGDVLYESNTITILKPALLNLFWTPSAINEGVSSSLGFNLSNVGTNRTRNFTLTNTGSASAADFNGSLPLSRSQSPATFVQVSYTTVEDLVTEGPETLTVAISYGGYAAWGSTTLTIVDTSVFPSISSVTPSTTNITEGNTVTFTVTDSTGSGGTLYWTINTSGGVSAADFSPATLSGSFALTSGSGTIDITPIAEGSAEGETFTLEIRYGSTSGTILATSTAVTITDAAAPLGTDITTSFYEISNRFIDSQTYMGTTADYNGPYDVGEVQFDYTGTGSIYIVVKFTAATSFYNDVPIGGIQVLNSSKTAILHQFIFYDTGGGTGNSWTTTTASPAGLQPASGLNFTPATASGYTYSSIAFSSTANRMNWATGTGSSYTGAADGIGVSSTWSTNILPLGDATVSQIVGSSYMYCETSGTTTDHVCVARSPSISLTAGSWIRIAHALTGPTGTPMDPDDTLWVGIY